MSLVVMAEVIAVFYIIAAFFVFQLAGTMYYFNNIDIAKFGNLGYCAECAGKCTKCVGPLIVIIHTIILIPIFV